MMAKENKLQSVERAFSVIELLDVYGELGVTEIGKRLSLDKSTAFRVLATLRSLGYIVQNPSSSKYYNSYKLFEIGTSVARRTGLPKLAHPYMLKLSQLTGEAVNLAIRDGTQADGFLDVLGKAGLREQDALLVSGLTSAERAERALAGKLACLE